VDDRLVYRDVQRGGGTGVNHKRHKPRRKVKCRICTDNRYGNSLKDAPRRIRIARDTSWKERV